MQAIRLANSKQSWIPIGWIFLIHHTVQALLVQGKVYDVSGPFWSLLCTWLQTKFNGKIYYQKFWTMPVSIYKPVKAALENDGRQYVKDIEADLNKRVDGVPKRSIMSL